MLDKLLATKEDFAAFRDISANIKDSKIDIFIRESQLIEVRNFLGPQLYKLLLDDYDEQTKTFTSTIYSSLWNGSSYTTSEGKEEIFNGLINALIYFTYSRFILQQQMNVSRFGLESIQDTISEDTPVGAVRTKAKEALSVALVYQRDAEKFIESNKTDYPTYATKTTKAKKTSFNFFKL